jgi:Enoyl-CoA hydratase/carnithine racemase
MPDIYIRQHNDILWLILNKHPHNMLTVGMLEQLVVALENALRKSPSLIVITGTGDEAFCSGIESQKVALRRLFAPVAERAVNVIRRLREQHVSMVALVKGEALGAGCELAIQCDTIIAREDALFQLPEVGESIFPNALTVALPSFIGKDETVRLTKSAAMIDARQASRLGLVQQVISPRRFTQDVEELLVMLSLSPQA